MITPFDREGIQFPARVNLTAALYARLFLSKAISNPGLTSNMSHYPWFWNKLGSSRANFQFESQPWIDDVSPLESRDLWCHCCCCCYLKFLSNFEQLGPLFCHRAQNDIFLLLRRGKTCIFPIYVSWFFPNFFSALHQFTSVIEVSAKPKIPSFCKATFFHTCHSSGFPDNILK